MSRRRHRERKPQPRGPLDPKHGIIPKFNPRHPLWKTILDRLGTGVYNYTQVSVWAGSTGHPLSAYQIQSGLKRYEEKAYSLPLKVFPWLAEMVQSVLDNFIDWDVQADAAIQQQVQAIGMILEQMRGLRDRPEVVMAADGVTPLLVTNEQGVQHNVILPAHTLQQKVDILEALQRAVNRLFKMILERQARHDNVRGQMPGQIPSQIGAGTPEPLYNDENMKKLRDVMAEADRELRHGYQLLIKEATETGVNLPEPVPLRDKESEDTE